MREITDDEMRQSLATSKEYSMMILKAGPQQDQPGGKQIVWEHGRRNLALRAEGLLSIVCPVRSGDDLAGVGIFNASVEETRRIMDDDPGVKAGVFVYEVYPCRGFPGDRLPE